MANKQEYIPDNISVNEDIRQKDDGVRSDETKYEEDDHTRVEDDEDDFDWDNDDDDDDESDNSQVGNRPHFFLCLSSSSSKLSWICFLVLTAISVSVCIAVFVAVKPQQDPTMTSYNLALWFTFIAFMFCVTLVMQMIIEVIPWIVRNIAAIVAPSKSELIRFKIAYYLDLKTYTKLVAIGAWAWGSWAFLRKEVDLPEGSIRPDYVKTLEMVWEILFLLTLFIFLEKFLLQFIATSFHKKAYDERLTANRRSLRILDKLKVAKPINPQEPLLKRIYKKKNATEYYANANLQAGKSIINNKTHPEEDDRVVRFPSNRKIDTLIAIPPVNTIDEEKPKKKTYLKTLSNKLKPKEKEEEILQAEEEEEERAERNLQEDEDHNHPKLSRSNTSISSLSSTSDANKSATSYLYSGYMKLSKESAFQDPIHQAKHLARRIYYNIMGVNPSRPYVLEADLYPFFRTLADAKEAFQLFDIDDNGSISRREMRAGCIRIYRDRRDLARSMRDMSQATGKLDILLLIVFICIWIVVAMAVFGVNVRSQLTPLWSAFIAASFIFKNSAKDAFESIIFVFVTHAFDTGDRIYIGDLNWVVNNVGIMVTTFKSLDGSVVYAKNSVLASKYIINCRRTDRPSELFDIQVSFHTPSWKLQELQDRMVEWNNQFPKLYTKDACGANITALENLNRLSIKFFFKHAKNWQDDNGRWLRLNNFMMELKNQLQELGITYARPEQPVRLKFYGDEEKEDDDNKNTLRRRTRWNNTSKIQNYGGCSSSSAAGPSSGEGDVG
ncbi:Mechanosensitive ion channel-domain-containing protein [Thamnidium elegans]|nr:Mechanosensitive ion channel-domain-containing protein [Thamnidium elegans]